MLLGGDGISRSTDSGTTWLPQSIDLRLPYGPCTWYTNINSIVRNGAGALFAGGHRVFRSTDNGATWTQSVDGMTHHYYTSSTVSTNAVAITSTGRLYAVTGSGIYRSTDGGGSWSGCAPGLMDTNFVSFVECTGGPLLAGASGGVFRSTDSGSSWYPQSVGSGPNPVFMLTEPIAGAVFAGTGHGLFRSSDNGSTWSLAASVPTSARVTCVHALPGGHLLAGTTGAGIYRSTDGGFQWSFLSQGPAAGVQAFQNGSSGRLFAGTENGLFQSTDLGSSWSQSQFTSATCFAVAGLEYGVLFAATDRGLFMSTNQGGSWTVLSGEHTRSVAFSSNGTLYSGGGVCGSGVERRLHFGAGSPMQILGHSESDLFRALGVSSAGTVFSDHQNGVKRSTNLGASWTQVLPGRLESFAVHSNSVVLACASEVLYRSSNDGVSWTAVGPANAYADDIARGPNGVLYLSANGRVYTSNDSGISWSQLGTALPISTWFGQVVRELLPASSVSIAAYPAQLLAGTVDGVYRSNDSGATWALVQNGLPALPCYTLEKDYQGLLYAGLYKGGIYRTTGPLPVSLSAFSAAVRGADVLSSWITESETNNRGFEVERALQGKDDWAVLGFIEGAGTSCRRHEYVFIDRNVPVGSYSYRLRQIDNDGTQSYSHVVDVEMQMLPAGWTLRGMYPNPAQDAVTLHFDAPEASAVRLTVCDLLGREIAVLYEGASRAGSNSVILRTNGFAHGACILALHTPAATLTRLITLR
jgi:hypothetical protein